MAEISSYIIPCKKRVIKCLKCGYTGEMSLFSTGTHLYFKHIPIKKIHNHVFAVCPKCKQKIIQK